MNVSSFKWGACVLASTLLALTASQSAFGQNFGAGGNQEQEEARQVAALKAAQKEALAEEIIALKEDAGQRLFDPAYRERLKRHLASSLSREELEAAVYDPGSVPLVLGDSSADLVYTPVTPCRIIDTRFAVPFLGPIAGGTTREFWAAGATDDFSWQGGSATGCGVPLGPTTAVAVNIVAVTPAGAGNLRAFAWDSPAPPAPTAAVLNYGPLTALPALANGTIVPICDQAVSPCVLGFDWIIQADVSAVHVVVDIVGFFSRVDASVLLRATSNEPFVNSTTSPVSADVLTGVQAPTAGGLLIDLSFSCASFSGTTNTRWDVTPMVDGSPHDNLVLFFPHADVGLTGDTASGSFFHPVSAGSHTVSYTASRSPGDGSLDCNIYVSSLFVPFDNAGTVP